jgi:hypothetical protein
MLRQKASGLIIKRRSRVNLPYFHDTLENRMVHEGLKIIEESNDVMIKIGDKRALSAVNRIRNYKKSFETLIRRRNGCTSSQILNETLRKCFLYPKNALLPSPEL